MPFFADCLGIKDLFLIALRIKCDSRTHLITSNQANAPSQKASLSAVTPFSARQTREKSLAKRVLFVNRTSIYGNIITNPSSLVNLFSHLYCLYRIIHKKADNCAHCPLALPRLFSIVYSPSLLSFGAALLLCVKEYTRKISNEANTA